MQRFVELLEKILAWICFFFFAGLILIGAIQIFLRYVFDYPLTWPEELMITQTIWFVFLGSVILLIVNRHIAMPLVVEQIKSRKVRKAIDVLNKALTIFFLSYLIWGSIKIQPVQMSYRTPALGLPRNVHSVVVLISSILMLLLILVWFLRDIRALFTLLSSPDKKEAQSRDSRG